MKKSIFSRWFKRNSASNKAQKLTPDDIRRKLADYQRREGPVAFGETHLYQVEEVESQEQAPEKPDTENA